MCAMFIKGLKNKGVLFCLKSVFFRGVKKTDAVKCELAQRIGRNVTIFLKCESI